jgi:hypothetical protein
MRSGARRYRNGIQECRKHATRKRRSPRFFPVSDITRFLSRPYLAEPQDSRIISFGLMCNV